MISTKGLAFWCAFDRIECSRIRNHGTTNCTTAIRQQRDAEKRMPFDWRMLVNGKGDEMLYERNYVLKGGLEFAELKRRSHVNEAAQSVAPGDNFSQRIRAGLPW